MPLRLPSPLLSWRNCNHAMPPPAPTLGIRRRQRRASAGAHVGHPTVPAVVKMYAVVQATGASPSMKRSQLSDIAAMCRASLASSPTRVEVHVQVEAASGGKALLHDGGELGGAGSERPEDDVLHVAEGRLRCGWRCWCGLSARYDASRTNSRRVGRLSTTTWEKPGTRPSGPGRMGGVGQRLGFADQVTVPPRTRREGRARYACPQPRPPTPTPRPPAGRPRRRGRPRKGDRAPGPPR